MDLIHHNIRWWVLCWTLTLFPIIAAVGQSATPLTRHYDTNDGLPSSEVYRVLQDRDGYMWFATDNGVSHFNGYEFENYGIQEGLSDVVALDMKLDDAGTIWIRTLSNNLYYLDRYSGNFKSFEFNNIIVKYAPFVSDLKNFHYSFQEKQLVAGITDLGFLIIDSIGNYRIQSNNCVGGCLEIFNNGKIAISNFKSRYIDDNEQVTFKTNQVLNTAFLLKDSSVLVSFTDRLIQLSGNKVIDSSSHTLIDRMYEDDKGNIFEFGLKNGIRLYKKIADLIHEANVFNLLNQYYITDILKDKEGNYWITTLYQGVLLCPSLHNFIAVEKIKKFEVIRDIIVQNENIWAINYDFEPFRISISSADFELYNNTLGRKFQRLFHLDSTDLLVFLNYVDDQVLIKNVSSTNRLSDMVQIESVAILNVSYAKNDEEIQMVGRNYSLFLNMKNFKMSDQIELPARGTSILKNSRSQIWIGTISGLYRVEGDSLIRTEIVKDRPDLRIEELLQFDDGRMVAASKGAGVIIWDDKDTFQITQADGLTSDMIENIHLDSKNNIWVGTLSGANRISFTSDTSYIIDQYTTRLGLPSNEINRIASYEDKVYLATNGGLIALNNVNQSSHNIAPSIIALSSVNEQHEVGGPIRLPYNDNDITISYITLDYLMNGNIEYRYRVNSGEWHMTFSREISFLNLPPDTYNIEIQSKNAQHQWSQPAYATFTIRPAWFNTWWARSLASSILLFLAYTFYKYKIKLERKESLLLQEIRTMEQSALNAQMNPHFVFNCLNSIQNFVVSNDSINAAEYLSKFARLIRSTLNSSVNNCITLSDEVQMLENYLSLEKLRFKDKLNYTISMDRNLLHSSAIIPSFLIQPLVENAVIHGIQNSSGQGFIYTNFEKTGDGLLKVTIEDNGLGLGTSHSGIHNKSLATSIVRRRIELLNQNSHVNSFVIENITDGESIKGVRSTLVIKVTGSL